MKNIMLVIDMQRDFIDGALGTPEARAILPLVVRKMREFDGDILYTLDTHTENYLDTQEGHFLPVPHCIKGTPGWELAPEIASICREKMCKGIEKPTFGSAALPSYLKENYPEGIERIALIGLCTDICVISNALILKAYFTETPICVYADCCAGVTPQSHMNALEAMKMCQIRIL